MNRQIEIISDQLGKAVRDGLFNDVWYYVKDFKNYKLQFILEVFDKDEDGSNSYILGELNPDGFKDIYGNYHFIKFGKISNHFLGSKYIPPKYDINILGSGAFTLSQLKSEYDDKINPLIDPYDIELLPYEYHAKEPSFSVSLPFELLHKVEEAIIYYLFSNESTRKYLFNLGDLLYNVEDNFDSYFNFVSIITDENQNKLPNVFLGLDVDEYDCTILPLNHDVILDLNKILDYPIILSNDLPKLPKTLLDDLREIELKELNAVYDRGIVFREYHRLIERLANYIYCKLYDEIQKACMVFTDEKTRKYFNINEMVAKKDNYKVMSLDRFSKLLRFLTTKDLKVINEDMKTELKKEFIPIVDTYSGFSQLRNLQTHDRIPIDTSILISGINAFKIVMRDGYKLFSEVMKEK